MKLQDLVRSKSKSIKKLEKLLDDAANITDPIERKKTESDIRHKIKIRQALEDDTDYSRQPSKKIPKNTELEYKPSKEASLTTGKRNNAYKERKLSDEKRNKLVMEASGDEKLDELANKVELDTTRGRGQKAVDRYSGNSMRKLLNDAYEEGNLKEIKRLGKARNKVPLVKAVLEDDLDTIIKNARNLNQQGRDALLQILEERGDVKKMFALNEELGGKYLTKDLSKKTSDTQNRIADLMETQAQINKRFYAPEDLSNVDRVVNPLDDAVAEMSGMSALDRRNMKNPIRERMIADRFKQGQEFVGDFDEVLMNDYLTKEDLMKNPRTQKYLAKEAADLESRSGGGYISSSERKRLAGLSGERDVKKARPYMLEEDASNRKLESDLREVRREIDMYGPQDSLLNEEAELMEQLAESKRLSYNRDTDHIMEQFEEPRIVERRHPKPRSMPNERTGIDKTLDREDTKRKLIEAAANTKDPEKLQQMREIYRTLLAK